MNEEKKHRSGTIVDLGAALMGRLNTDQSLYVHGIFEGDLQVTKTVFIDIEGQVSADVTAEHVVVQGTVIGNIKAEQVIIHANGKVWGDVCAQVLYVEAGGFLRGQVIIPHESEPKLYPQTPESSDDFDISPPQPLSDDDPADSSVELQMDVPASLFVDSLTDELTCVTIEQQTAQQDNAWTEPDETHQAASAQPTAGLETVRREVAQPDAQLIEKEEAETTSLQADLGTSQDEIKEQQQTYTAYCLICSAYRRIEGARQVTLPDGRSIVKGHCTVCGMRFTEQLHLE